MQTITMKDIHFEGSLSDLRGNKIIESRLQNFSCEFEFGKSYFLYSEPGAGSWAVSWLIGGAIEHSRGIILCDGADYLKSERKYNSWFLRYSEIKRFGLFRQSAKAQVCHGLRKSGNFPGEAERNIIAKFYLTAQRYVRPLNQMGNEAWRASAAIGFANDKKVFCFPHIGFLRSTLFSEYGDLWLGEMMQILCNSGAVVIVPSNQSGDGTNLFDEVVYI